MVDHGGGKVVFISSVAARLGGRGFSPAYAAAKAGLLGLSTALAVQLEDTGILVNAVMPGTLGTTGSPLTDSETAEYLRTYPLGFGGPAPVAAAVEYLLDTSGDWISGAHLNVSGGRLRGP
jgi:NAD(P)-dependent dehydrogenase (short-subunit alcohol dehydrogenase family)